MPVKVLSRLFRRRFLEELRKAHERGELKFFGDLSVLTNPSWFAEHLRPLKTIDWVVYAKRPFAGPEAVLTYLSRYTHRVAISNARLVAFDERGVTFRYQDYRIKNRERWKSMTLATDEFIRRFLLHVLPRGFHRIRHYALLANTTRNDNLKRVRAPLRAHLQANADTQSNANDLSDHSRCAFTCAQCGAPMVVVAILLPQHAPRAPPQNRVA